MINKSSMPKTIKKTNTAASAKGRPSSAKASGGLTASSKIQTKSVKKPAVAKTVKTKPEKEVKVIPTGRQARLPARQAMPTGRQAMPTGRQAEKPTLKPRRKRSLVDTGSVDFQIQNFTEKINSLVKHLKAHPHDYDSRRGLLIMVGKRRRLLNYVKKTDDKKYEKLVGALKLKKTINKEEK